MNEIRLHTAIGPKGKQIIGMLVRIPNTKDTAKNPSRMAAVYDSRRNPIRELWFRLPHGPWVAQITTTKMTLKAATLAQAREEHQRLKIQSRDGALPALGKSPSFTVFADEYMKSVAAEAKKCVSTIKAKNCRIRWWQTFLASIPLNKITLPTIRKGIAKLKKEGNKNRQLADRSLNYYVTAVNLILNRAVEEGWLITPPIPSKSLWRKLKRPERPFVTEEEFNRLCESALTFRVNVRKD